MKSLEVGTHSCLVLVFWSPLWFLNRQVNHMGNKYNTTRYFPARVESLIQLLEPIAVELTQWSVEGVTPSTIASTQNLRELLVPWLWMTNFGFGRREGIHDGSNCEEYDALVTFPFNVIHNQSLLIIHKELSVVWEKISQLLVGFRLRTDILQTKAWFIVLLLISWEEQ